MTELLRHCAYNQTSDRLLGVDVAAADFSDVTLHERIQALRPRSGTGLWMVPFRGIPTGGLGMPLDLLYLDEGCHVIDTVESFPRYRVSSSARPAASVLALPSESIAITHTQPGDQVLVCTPDELKNRLNPHPQNTSALDREAAPAPQNQETAPLQTGQRMANGKPVKAKSWWQKLIDPDPQEPRRAIREAIPGLAALYWTGGEATPHAVRDISASGLYLVTDERWYPGTIVRMTLACRDAQGRELSVAVQTRAVRWGNDGVGLEFVMLDPDSPSRGEWLAPDGANRDQFEGFIKKIKGI